MSPTGSDRGIIIVHFLGHDQGLLRREGGMATRRKANEDRSEREKAPEGDGSSNSSSGESRLRQSRQEHKAGVQRQQKKLDTLRWVLVGVAILLILIGLYYYFTNVYQPVTKEGVAKRGERGGKTEGGRGGVKGGKEEGKGSKEKPPKATEKKAKEKSGSNSKASKPEKSKRSEKGKESGSAKTKPPKKDTSKAQVPPRKKSEEEVQAIPLSEMRLLRRPVPADDPDRPYIIEILNGDNLLIEKRFSEGLEKFNEILKMFPQSPRGLFGKGETLAGLAAQKSSNKLRDTAIEFYQDAASSFLAPRDIKLAALARLAELNQERGKFTAAVTALEKLYELDHNDTTVANRLGTGYLTAGQSRKAEEHFRKVVKRIPDNYYAKAHLGFLLYEGKQYEAALPLLMEGLRRDKSIQSNGRFYLYAGEALSRLNRSDEAHVLYSEAVSRDLFPSLYQRSLFNEPGLRAMPWWTLEDTGYQKQLQPILDSLPNITSEVVSVLQDTTSPSPVFSLFSNGKKNAQNCRKVPLTCSLLESFPEATTCKHGEVKFILVPPGAHVPPHTGPTNTRLEVVVGLSLGEGELQIRLAEETRTLQSGEVVVYDDSFEQELWHNSSGVGLVLSMDVWHPDFTVEQRRRMTPVH